MKRKYFLSCILSVVLLFSLISSALAAPAAELSMHIVDWEQLEDAVEFSIAIDIGEPSEPYASLDFNIISSSEEHLSVVDLSETGDNSKLAFEFSPDYGGAYHKGRLDETRGSVSYLAGIFSQSSGNNITTATRVCTVRLRYTGSVEQELSLENLKLIYKNSDGEITSVAPEMKVSQSISMAEFAQLPSENAPSTGDETTAAEGKDATSTSVIVYILLACAAIIVIAVFVFLKRKSGKRNSA